MRALLTIAACVGIPLNGYPVPSWWADHVVLDTSAVADDYAPANQGQLKNIAKAAVAEMDAKLPGGAGTALHELVDSWATTSSHTNDFAPVNVGQLKRVAKSFYDRLITARYAEQYPWTSNATAVDDFAAANVGQVKHLFAFDLSSTDLVHDTDRNDIADWWEKYHFDYIGVDPQGAAPRGDGVTNRDAFQRQLNPIDFYNGSLPHAERLSGDRQTGSAGAVFAEPIVVRITSSTGEPLAQAPITFTVDSSGASVAASRSAIFRSTVTVRTRADGAGTAYVRAGQIARPTVITASIHSGANTISLTFELTTLAAALPTVTVVSGNNQTATRSKPLFYPLVVRVADASGAPVTSSSVMFTVAPGAGGLALGGTGTPGSALNVATDPSGLAAAQFFTPDSPGPVSIYAAIGDGASSAMVVVSATVRDYPTAPPAAPSGLTATPNADGSTELAWTANSTNEDYFIIERQNADGTWTQVGEVGPGRTHFVAPPR